MGIFQFAGHSGGLFAYADYKYLARETGITGRGFFYRVVASSKDLSLEEQEALGRRTLIQA